jgi:hypothetical protein
MDRVIWGFLRRASQLVGEFYEQRILTCQLTKFMPRVRLYRVVLAGPAPGACVGGIRFW